MFNQPPSPENLPKEEQLENKLRTALSSFFQSVGEYKGYEAAVQPQIHKLKALFSEIKDGETLRVIISESVASATEDKEEQLALVQKLTSTFARIDLINNTKG